MNLKPALWSILALAVVLFCIYMITKPAGDKESPVPKTEANESLQTVPVPAPPEEAPRDEAQGPEYPFESVAFRTANALFLETTLEPFSEPEKEWTMEAGPFSSMDRPLNLDLFGLPPGWVREKGFPEMNHTYSAIIGNSVIGMVPEGYTYYFDDGCGDHQVLIKIVPSEPVDEKMFSESHPVVLRMPSSELSNVNSFSFQRSDVHEDLKERILAIIDPELKTFSDLDMGLYSSHGFPYKYVSTAYWIGVEGGYPGELVQVVEGASGGGDGQETLVTVVPYPEQSVSPLHLVSIDGRWFAVCSVPYQTRVYKLPAGADGSPGVSSWKLYKSFRVYGGEC